MSSTPDPAPPPPGPPPGPRPPTVFLSYASEDRPSAQLLREALPSHGVEVWYDETDLTGGDAWDHKIRQQIRDCDFFMPVISAQTEARHEGYFRREWRLAVERSLDMADDHLFLLPVVIDDTPQADARVPEKFLAVQWTRVPGGQPNAAFDTLCRRILAGDVRPATRAGGARTHAPAGASPPLRPLPAPPLEPAAAEGPVPEAGAAAATTGPPPTLSPFPQADPDKKIRYLLEVVVWGVESGWTLFKRLPLVWRAAAYIWLGITLLSTCSHRDEDVHISAAEARRLAALQSNYRGGSPEDVAQFVAQARRVAAGAMASGGAAASGDAPAAPAGPVLLLAIPFTAPPGDAEAGQLASATFAQVYGRLSMSHHGQVDLTEPLPAVDNKTALDRARRRQASYVLLGSVDAGPRVTVRILKTDTGLEAWSKDYTSRDTDPTAIATEVDGGVHAHVDD